MKLIPTAPRRTMLVVLLCAASFPTRSARAQVRFPYEAAGPTGQRGTFGPGPLDFSPDSRYLAMPCDGNRVLLWDLREGAKAAVLDHAAGNRQSALLLALFFAGDGRTLAALYFGISGDTRESELVLFDVAKRGERAAIPFGRTELPRAMAFSPDGAKLVMVIPRGKGRSVSFEVKVWDVRTAEPVRSLDTAPCCSDVAYSPDGQWLATVHGISDDKGQIFVWDAETFERRQALRAGGGWLSLAFSPDSKLIAAGIHHQNRRKLVPSIVRVWDVTSGKEAGLADIDVGHDRNNATVLPLFAPDSQSLIATCNSSASPETHFELWNLASGDQRFLARGESRPHDGIHSRADFSPDGRLLATTGTDPRADITLWDTKYWNVIRRLDTSATGESGSRGSTIGCVRFSPDSKWLAALRHDFLLPRANVHHQEVLLWNLAETLDTPSDSLAPKLNR